MESFSPPLKILLNSLRVPRINRFRFPRRGRLCDSGAAQNDATAMPASAKPERFTYIDWLRGFACLLMFQVHAYDSWLSPSARETRFFKWSQLSGTLPAPMFLFLAGVSFALVTDKLRRKGVPANEIARKTILRGAEILALGYGFRLQEYLLGLPWAPWTDLLRVDILNTIGFSMILMGVVCWFARTRMANLVLAFAATAAIALATPPLYTTWRPSWLPWYLESYINGVHTLKTPQAWLFPVFPWAAFAFAGLALGFFLFDDWAMKNQAKVVTLLGALGIALYYFSMWLDARVDAALRGVRLLAHQPQFFYGPRRDPAGDVSAEFRVVPLGSFAGPVQPDGAAGPDVPAGLLGAH